MNFNWKIAVPVGIAALLVLVFLFAQTRTRTQETGVPAPADTLTPAQLPPATGNIDDALKAFLALGEDENALAQQDDDSDLVSFDDQELGGFDQSF